MERQSSECSRWLLTAILAILVIHVVVVWQMNILQNVYLHRNYQMIQANQAAIHSLEIRVDQKRN
jgi:hypothetical protein